MGFSVSGSAAIIFAGMFISFGMFYAATANSTESISAAREDRADTIVEEKNSDVAIRSVTYVNDRLTVLVNNTGAEPLSVNGTDFLVDNTYRSGWESSAKVNGDSDTDLWLPREQLNITIRMETAPTRVKVAAENGVADTAEVP